VHEIPATDAYQIRRRSDFELEVEVASGRGLNELFNLLSAQGLVVLSMRTKTNRLEELFMRLVEDKQTVSNL
jgi:ABC-2 type transport system ATP-binding protein